MRHTVWIVLLAGCGTDVAMNGNGGTSPDGGASADLFQANCARCHGADANGTSDAPQIRDEVHAYATYVIRNGREDQMGFGQAMPSFSAADVPDLDPIFAWLDRPPQPTDGPTLYARHCGNCHGANAQGGRVGKNIAGEESDDVSERVREGHDGSNYGARTKYMPSWSTNDLSDADVSAISAYLATLPGGDGGDGDGGDGDDDGDGH